MTGQDKTGETVNLAKMNLLINGLKGEIKKWIDANFDHNVILSQEDHEMGDAISNITKQNVCYLPYSPTAENISYYLKDKVFPNIFQQKGFIITQVKLQETASCWAMV